MLENFGAIAELAGFAGGGFLGRVGSSLSASFGVPPFSLPSSASASRLGGTLADVFSRPLAQTRRTQCPRPLQVQEPGRHCRGGRELEVVAGVFHDEVLRGHASPAGGARHHSQGTPASGGSSSGSFSFREPSEQPCVRIRVFTRALRVTLRVVSRAGALGRRCAHCVALFNRSFCTGAMRELAEEQHPLPHPCSSVSSSHAWTAAILLV